MIGTVDPDMILDVTARAAEVMDHLGYNPTTAKLNRARRKLDALWDSH